MAQASVWDRQRAAVREEIIRTAVELFLSQGFEATTIDQIVGAVGVSRRSFFRYFGTKEDVVLGDLAARGEAIAANLAERPEDEGPWDAIRGAFHEAQQTSMTDEASELALGRMLFDTPSLRARFLEKRLRWHNLFVPLVAHRLPGRVDASKLAAAAIVGSALACLDAASEIWVATGGSGSLADLYDDAVAAVRR
ncbi:TetR family transcriptional regulator [soil metagenome]